MISFKNRWIICEMAVTASHGEDITFAVQAAPGGDVYEGLVDTGRGGKTKKVIVQTTSIDHEWNNAGRPDVSVIKIDVEGHEIDVLHGAEKTLRTHKPTLIVEIHDTKKSLVPEFLFSLGYSQMIPRIHANYLFIV